MKLKNNLINTSEIFYNEMFSSSSKLKHKISENYSENYIEKDRLANTSIIFYEDMIKTKY